MGQAFPELTRAQTMIEETLQTEETRFHKTLDRGLALLDEAVEALPDDAPLPGETAFKLYDTFGFPLDLTQDALRERGRTVDIPGFDASMAAQKAQARAAWSGSGDAADESVWFDLRDRHGATEFLGYTTTDVEGQILALVIDGEVRTEAKEGETAELIANQTPFYAESGGQVGDTGTIRADGGTARVIDTRKKFGDLFVHRVEVTSGTLHAGEAARMTVDAARRDAIRGNHSATHLLHEALRTHLGDHVAQRGSLVAPDRLRFDFAHQKAMGLDEIRAVERDVNAYIRQNDAVSTRSMTPDEAVEMGARALFGEKYGDEVRVVSMGRRPEGEESATGALYSLELCGGTHVGVTGEIGMMVVTGESASASGIRRIEALTGEAAFDYLSRQDHTVAEAAMVLKSRPEEVVERTRALVEERRALQNEIAALKKQLALAGPAEGGGAAAKDVGGVRFVGQILSGVSGKDLRGLIDAHKERIGSGVVVLVADTGGKAAVAAGVTDDLTDRVSAVDLVTAAATKMGGKGGGGRPDMAQAGGPDPSKAAEALAAAEAVIEGAA